jgi:hypothetical protein
LGAASRSGEHHDTGDDRASHARQRFPPGSNCQRRRAQRAFRVASKRRATRRRRPCTRNHQLSARCSYTTVRRRNRSATGYIRNRLRYRKCQHRGEAPGPVVRRPRRGSSWSRRCKRNRCNRTSPRPRDRDRPKREARHR